MLKAITGRSIKMLPFEFPHEEVHDSGGQETVGTTEFQRHPADRVTSTKRFTFLLEQIRLHLDLPQNNWCTLTTGFDPPFLRLDSPSLNSNGNLAPSADGTSPSPSCP